MIGVRLRASERTIRRQIGPVIQSVRRETRRVSRSISKKCFTALLLIANIITTRLLLTAAAAARNLRVVCQQIYDLVTPPAAAAHTFNF